MTNGNDTAMPQIQTEFATDEYSRPFGNTYSSGGLTKREYFAAMAMQGMLSTANGEYGFVDSYRHVFDENGQQKLNEDGDWLTETTETAEQKYAKAAVAHADALIEALNAEAQQ